MAKLDVKQLNKEIATVDNERDTTLTETLEFTNSGSKIHSSGNSIVFQTNTREPIFEVEYGEPSDSNYFGISSSQPGSPVILYTKGDQPDIDLEITPKGQGKLLLSNLHIKDRLSPFSPFTIPANGNVRVNNLNAHFIDGYSAQDFLDINNLSGVMQTSQGGTGNTGFSPYKFVYYDPNSNSLESSSVSISEVTGGVNVSLFEPADPSIIKKADVVDSLTSSEVSLPLSANQGKVLEDTKVSLPVSIINGNLIGFDSSGEVTTDTVSYEDIVLENDISQKGSLVFRVDPNKTSLLDTPDGSVESPFTTLQDALDTIPDKSTVLVSGNLQEDVEFNRDIEVHIQGYGKAHSKIEGEVSFNSVGVSAHIENLSIDNSSQVLALSQYLEANFHNCKISSSSPSGYGISIDNNVPSSKVKFSRSDLTEISDGLDVNLVDPSSQLTIKSSDVVGSLDIRNSSSGKVSLKDIVGFLNLNHLNGALEVEDSELGDFTSSSNNPSYSLVLRGNSFRKPDYTFFNVSKTGTCDYFISDNDLPLNISFTGNSLGKSLLGQDVKLSNNPQNYTSSGEILEEHITGIDQKLSQISLSGTLFKKGNELFFYSDGDTLKIDLENNEVKGEPLSVSNIANPLVWETLFVFSEITIDLNGVRLSASTDYSIIDSNKVSIFYPIIDSTLETVIADYTKI